MNIFHQEGNLRPAGSVEVQEGNHYGAPAPMAAGSVEVHFSIEQFRKHIKRQFWNSKV